MFKNSDCAVSILEVSVEVAADDISEKINYFRPKNGYFM